MIKVIKKDCIGAKYSINYNGIKFSGTISDSPENIEHYLRLGLDVFEYVDKKPAVELVKKRNAKNTKKHS